MINHFTFNGTSTAQLGLIVSGVSIFGAGSRKVEKAGIPGRNGDLQIELGGFNNYTVRYTVSITKNFTTTAQQIREWLLESKGYCNLTDTYHPDEIRKACFNSDIEFTTSMLYKYGQASIQFDCLPERYLTTNTPITTTATADTTTDTTMSLSTVPTPINISLNGNTEQAGSSGKNKLPIEAYTGIPYNPSAGTTISPTAKPTQWTNNGNGTFKMTLTSWEQASLITAPLTAGRYVARVTTVTAGMIIGIYVVNADGTSNRVSALKNGTTANEAFQVATTLTAGQYFAFYIAGGSGECIIKEPMVEAGSTATSYEPHISPTNPQVIHNVSGDNEITVVNKNLFDIENDYVNTKFSLSGGTLFNTATDTRTYFLLSILALNGNTVVSVIYSNSFSTTGEKSVTFNSGDLSNVTRLRLKHNGSINDLEIAYVEKSSFTSNTNYTLSFNLISNNPTTVNGLIISNIQLEKGSTATTYEPYTRQSYPLYLPVENLLDSDLLLEASGWTVNNGVYSGLNSTLHNKWGTNTNGIYNTFEQGQQYTFSFDLKKDGTGFGALVIRFYYTDNTYDGKQIDGTSEWKRYTFTSTSTTKTLSKLILSYGNTFTIYLKNIQLEKGAKENAYHSYGTPPIELNKIGTYSDYIYKNGSKWYVHKAITKVDLGTLDSWNSYNDTFYANLVEAIIAPSSGIASILCTSYRATSMASVISKLEDKAIALNTGQSRCNVYDSSYNASTIGNFINSVKGVWLYYPLATATNTEITDTTLINQLNNIEKAYSYDGTTNILQVSNDNGFMLSVVSLHGSTFNSNYKGEPIITVNATGLIYLNGEVMEVLSAPVTINCQTMQCYNGGVNMNNEVRVNDFPEIKIGANEIGSSMALTITPNNWRH